MTADDGQNDSTLAAVATLKRYDLSRRHARRLRRQCHAVLQAQAGPERPVVEMRGTTFQRVIGPALGGAWCVAYLVEMMRRAAAVYLGT